MLFGYTQKPSVLFQYSHHFDKFVIKFVTCPNSTYLNSIKIIFEKTPQPTIHKNISNAFIKIHHVSQYFKILLFLTNRMPSFTFVVFCLLLLNYPVNKLSLLPFWERMALLLPIRSSLVLYRK